MSDTITSRLAEIARIKEELLKEEEQLTNEAALSERNDLKNKISEQFDNYKNELLNHCGSSVERLKEAIEKLSPLKLSFFISTQTAQTKPLDGIYIDGKILNLSELVLNKVSEEKNWASRTIANECYVVYYNKELYWIGRSGKMAIKIAGVSENTIVIRQKGKAPRLNSLDHKVAAFMVNFFNR